MKTQFPFTFLPKDHHVIQFGTYVRISILNGAWNINIMLTVEAEL